MLSWVCDSWYVVEHTPRLPGDTLVDAAIRARITLPLAAALRYLQDELATPLPDGLLQQLEPASDSANSVERDVALFLSHDGVWAKLNCLFRLREWRAKRLLLTSLLIPPREYVRWAYGLTKGWQAIVYYPYHLVRSATLIVLTRLKRA